MKIKQDSSLLRLINQGCKAGDETFEAIEEYVSLNGVIGAYRMQHTLFSDGQIQIYVEVVTGVPQFVYQFPPQAEDAALRLLRTLARFGLAELIERV